AARAFCSSPFFVLPHSDESTSHLINASQGVGALAPTFRPEKIRALAPEETLLFLLSAFMRRISLFDGANLRASPLHGARIDTDASWTRGHAFRFQNTPGAHSRCLGADDITLPYATWRERPQPPTCHSERSLRSDDLFS